MKKLLVTTVLLTFAGTASALDEPIFKTIGVKCSADNDGLRIRRALRIGVALP